LDSERQTLTEQPGGGYRVTRYRDDNPDSEGPAAPGGFDDSVCIMGNTNFTQGLAAAT
jgi:hypothetical protein